MTHYGLNPNIQAGGSAGPANSLGISLGHAGLKLAVAAKIKNYVFTNDLKSTIPAQEERSRSVDASSTKYTAKDHFSHWLFLPYPTNTKTIFIGSKLSLNQMFKLFSLAFKAFYISSSSYHLYSLL